jgi:hypothetical protein
VFVWSMCADITFDSKNFSSFFFFFFFFFFFLNRDVSILKEVAAVLVTTSSHSFLASVTANSYTHLFKYQLNET